MFIYTIVLTIAACSSKISGTTETLNTSSNENWETPLPLMSEIKQGTLSNGMKYFILKNKKPENRVELRLAVNAGSMQEDDDQKGLAHFVEHMAFNGTKNFEKNELVNYLESVGTKFGAHLNAYTSFDETVYMLQVPTDSQKILDQAFLIMKDWASAITFEDEEIDKERGVVLSEWRSRLGPERRMRDEYLKKIFYQSRYAERFPIGDTSILKNTPYDALKRFYKDWYRPDLMALMVVGDIDVETIEETIKTNFSSLSSPVQNARKKIDYNLPEHNETLVSVQSDKEASFTRVRIIYKHPTENTNSLNGYKSLLKRQLYNGMLNDRLSEMTKKENPPFLHASASYGKQLRTSDSYSLYTVAQEGNVLQSLEALIKENERVKKFGFTKSEFERKKVEILERYQNAFNERDKINSSSLIRELVGFYLSNEPVPGIQKEYSLAQSLLPQIKLEEINQLANKWVTNKNSVVVITMPEKEHIKKPSSTEVLSLIEKAKNTPVTPYEDDVSDEPLLSIGLEEGHCTKKHFNEKLGIHYLTLNNGVKVIFKPTDFKNDEIIMTAFSWGGTSLYNNADFWSAYYADNIINQSGLGNFSKIQLEKKLVGKTVNIAPHIRELNEGINGSCNPEDLETFMQLIYMYFNNIRNDQTAFKSFIQRNKSVYSNILQNPRYFFNDAIQKTLSDNHPRRGYPKPSNFDSISLEKVESIYKDRFADASDFTFVFVGNIDSNQLKHLSLKYLANLPSINRKETYKDIGIVSPKGKTTILLKKGKDPKTSVYLRLHGEAKWSMKDRFTFDAMVRILRIMMRESMREDKGGVYGVGVSGSIYNRPKEEFKFSISFNAEPNKTDELIQMAINDIDSLRTYGPSNENIKKIKETYKRDREKALKENNFWLQQIKFSEENGSKLNKIDQYYQEIDNLTADEIQDMAKTYLTFQNFTKIIMKPEEE